MLVRSGQVDLLYKQHRECPYRPHFFMSMYVNVVRSYAAFPGLHQSRSVSFTRFFGKAYSQRAHQRGGRRSPPQAVIFGHHYTLSQEPAMELRRLVPDLAGAFSAVGALAVYGWKC